jgi:hypothetical protein
MDSAVLPDVINSLNVSGVPNGLLMQLLGPGGLSPVVLAQAMNAHPEMTGQMLFNLDPTVISTALNANPQLLPDLLAMLDASVMTGSMTEGGDHVMKHLVLNVKAKAKVAILGWVTATSKLWTKYSSTTPPP